VGVGQDPVFNGRTGEPFEEQVSVGYMYVLKLLHLDDQVRCHGRAGEGV
jgi:DNA-directed RNA polymerase subunit beta